MGLATVWYVIGAVVAIIALIVLHLFLSLIGSGGGPIRPKFFPRRRFRIGGMKELAPYVDRLVHSESENTFLDVVSRSTRQGVTMSRRGACVQLTFRIPSKTRTLREGAIRDFFESERLRVTRDEAYRGVRALGYTVANDATVVRQICIKFLTAVEKANPDTPLDVGEYEY